MYEHNDIILPFPRAAKYNFKWRHDT